MKKVLFRARESFVSNTRGNVGIIFGFAAVPVIGLLGGAVDLTRHSRYNTELANAMDAAAVALVRRGASSDAEADDFVNEFIATMMPGNGDDAMLHLASFDATAVDGGYRVTANGYMDTAFMPVVGIRTLPLDLATEVVMSNGKYEIALALDNTGSMQHHGRIGALRDAAGQLVDDLYAEEGAEDRVKMALVPFVTTVNIKTPDVFRNDWIDPTGDSGAFGWNFSERVNRLSLFAGMRAEWKGCVEARKAPYDEDDVEPASADTRFVPYLWPDEPDGDDDYGNNYLRDSVSGSELERLRDVRKYRNVRAPNTSSSGPNAACPEPIVELTNDTARMQREILKMKPHNVRGGNSSGTNVAQGLMWGWQVLSPGEPFSQGVSYDDEETQKVLVLLSDGRNQVVSDTDMNDERVSKSDYTGYGYLAAGRMGSTSNYLNAERNVDDKVKRICEKVKDTGIRVYTILFQVDFEATKEIFRNCASKDDEGKPLFYYVPDASQLQTAFDKIGEDLSSLHIAR